MGREKIKISKALLERMYHKKNLSPRLIANELGCSWATIVNRLKDFDIRLKTSAAARMKYKKFDFKGTDEEKAYMVGFRLGDLSTHRRSEKSETIVVRCHTTHPEQVEVLKLLFEKYGHINISNKGNNFHVNCYLNNSFNFLIPKNLNAWRWVKSKPETSWAFVGGYTDAEGNLLLNQGKARFKIDSYDYEILNWISSWLDINNIKNKFRCICRKGETKYYRKSWNNDLWRLNINYADSLENFLKRVMPNLKHKRRIKHARICLANIKSRK